MAGAIKMTLSSREIKKVNRAIKRYGVNLENDLKDETQKSLLDLAANAKQNVKDNDSISTSRLINSITTSSNADRKGGFVIVNAVYGYWVEFGRKAGGFPPLAPLVAWVRKKITSDIKEAKGIAFLIARSIAKNGTKAKPFLMPAFTIYSKIYIKRLKQIIKKHERKVR